MNPSGLVLAGLGVALILGGLVFLPDEILLGPAGIALILGGLAIASKGSGVKA